MPGHTRDRSVFRSKVFPQPHKEASGKVTRRYAIDADAMQFMRLQGLDFGKWLSDGIPYLDREEEEKLSAASRIVAVLWRLSCAHPISCCPGVANARPPLWLRDIYSPTAQIFSQYCGVEQASASKDHEVKFLKDHVDRVKSALIDSSTGEIRPGAEVRLGKWEPKKKALYGRILSMPELKGKILFERRESSTGLMGCRDADVYFLNPVYLVSTIHLQEA